MVFTFTRRCIHHDVCWRLLSGNAGCSIGIVYLEETPGRVFASATCSSLESYKKRFFLRIYLISVLECSYTCRSIFVNALGFFFFRPFESHIQALRNSVAKKNIKNAHLLSAITRNSTNLPPLSAWISLCSPRTSILQIYLRLLYRSVFALYNCFVERVQFWNSKLGSGQICW